MRNTISALVAMLVTLGGLSAVEDSDTAILFLGNSLTGNLSPTRLAGLASSQGLQLDTGYVGAAGAPLNWLWANRGDEIRKELDKGIYQSLNLQPFNRPIDKDLAASQQIIDYMLQKIPDPQVYVYAQWPKHIGLPYEEMWHQDIAAWLADSSANGDLISPQRTAAYFEALTQALRQAYPDLPPVIMAPVGHVQQLLSEKINAGLVPGVESIFDSHSDSTHVNNQGGYIAGVTYYATIFGRNPVGLPVGDYQGDPAVPRRPVISPELAQIIQETAWEVVTSHPLTGVQSDQPVALVTPALPPAVTGEPYRWYMQPAYGQRPYQWQADGLPAGLSIDDDGRIVGTTALVGAYQVEIQVTDQANTSAMHSYDLVVEQDVAPQALPVDPPSLQRGAHVEFPLSAESGNRPLRWTATNLPKGLKMLPGGLLFGSPGFEGDWEVQVTVEDADRGDPESDTMLLSLHVGPAGAGVRLVAERPGDAIAENGVLDEASWQLQPLPMKTSRGIDSDNQVQVDVFWRNSHLFIGVEVIDDTICTGDSVEVFLDGFNDRQHEYNADDRRFVLTPDGELSGEPGMWPRYRAKATRTERGYTAEIRLNANNMRLKYEPGVCIGFDVAVNDDDDDDGEAEGQLVWWGSADNDTDPSGFGTIILVAEGEGEPVSLQLESQTRSHEQIDLKWNTIPDADRYLVVRQHGISNQLMLRILPEDSTSLVDRGLQPQTSYVYLVQAAQVPTP